MQVPVGQDLQRHLDGLPAPLVRHLRRRSKGDRDRDGRSGSPLCARRRLPREGRPDIAPETPALAPAGRDARPHRGDPNVASKSLNVP